MADEIGGVCIVTQPERGSSVKSHAHDLADIIAELTTVVLLTANLSEESNVRESHEIVEFSTSGAGNNILIEAIRFGLNQLRLCVALRGRGENTILFFGATSYLLPVLVTRLLGKQVIILPRGDVPLSLRLRWEESLPAVVARALASLVRGLEHLNYRLADAIVAYTPSMARQLDLDRYESKLFTNGARFVDTEQFDIEIPFEGRQRTVGFLGRLDVEKRIPELVDAAKQLPDDITFVFIGDGDYREQLEAELATEIENGTVEVVGWVDRADVPAQLNRLQLLIIPSHPTEGLPTAILEAMACGTPAYATPVSGVPDVVREGETGFLLQEVSGDSIARDIQSIIDHGELASISSNARKLITEEYSFKAAVERYEEIFKKGRYGQS